MANPVTVVAGARTYDAVEDRVLRFDALAVGVVTDEVTGRAPRTAVTVATSREGAVTKYFDHGLWCVSGDVERVLPGYPGVADAFDVGLSAPGYRPKSVPVTIAAGAALPVSAAAVQLRVFPVRVRGRVTRSTLDPSPVADAIVRIAPRPGQTLVSIRTPLHGAHAAATAVRSVVLNPAGTQRRLTAPAASGTRRIVLDDVTGLAGAVVALDWQRGLELVHVETVDAAAKTLTLSGPIARTHATGTFARRVSVSLAAAPVRALARDADAGDGLLLLNGALASGTRAVQVGVAGTPEVEYASVGVLTDADGYYTLDGIGGVETVDVRARATLASPEGPRFPQTLDYGQRINVVNLRLAP
jgi:hypothetical protein